MRRRRFAPAKPTKRRSCGCDVCAMKPSSTSRPEIPRIALTCGEPAGVGPELCLAVARAAFDCELVCVGDTHCMGGRARRIGTHVSLRRYDPCGRTPHTPGT